MFIRRDRPAGSRFLEVRIALFWVGVAVWIVGAILGQSWVTGTAIAILGVALVLGWIARREARGAAGGEDGKEEGETEG